jgi:hypothetical protein
MKSCDVGSAWTLQRDQQAIVPAITVKARHNGEVVHQCFTFAAFKSRSQLAECVISQLFCVIVDCFL